MLQRLKDWENGTLDYSRTASVPLQEDVLVAVLISRSPKEVRTYLRVQVREETAIEPCDSCSVTTCALERRGRHHAQRNLLKRIIQTSCRGC